MQNLDRRFSHQRIAAVCVASLAFGLVVGCPNTTPGLPTDNVAGGIIPPDVTNNPTSRPTNPGPADAPVPPSDPTAIVDISGQGDVTQEVNGATITLSAVASPGWSFSSWLGGVAAESRRDNPLTIATTATTIFPIRLTALFVLGAGDEPPVSDTPPPDADGDGVPDSLDLCAGTQLSDGVVVDATGCVVVVDPNDDDGDGVSNDADQCADTPAGTLVDRTGCPVSGGGGGGGGGGSGGVRPVCGDGSVDSSSGEQCDDGNTTNGDGCDSSCKLETCGDGVIDFGNGEECDDGNTTNGDGCDSNCVTETCGNGVVQTGEECDPPAAGICDGNCQLIAGGDNDNCSNPTSVGVGETSFSNVNATSDGPMEGLTCLGFDTDSDFADVWFTHTATCTGFVTVSLCASDPVYDTTLAVYDGFECPTSAPIVCSDDDCGFGVASRVSFAVVEGAELLIRIGGFENTPPEFSPRGNGTLKISCGDSPGGTEACGQADAGDCFTANGSAGCTDQTCCETVCAADPFCCEVDWDSFCSGAATGLCGTGFTACGAGAGDCNLAGDSPGCDNEACCQSVCESDTFCCLDTWDDVCASAARSCSR